MSECRLCYNLVVNEPPYCQCKGSLQHIHLDCLFEQLKDKQDYKCDLCQTNFQVTKKFIRTKKRKLMKFSDKCINFIQQTKLTNLFIMTLSFSAGLALYILHKHHNLHNMSQKTFLILDLICISIYAISFMITWTALFYKLYDVNLDKYDYEDKIILEPNILVDDEKKIHNNSEMTELQPLLVV